MYLYYTLAGNAGLLYMEHIHLSNMNSQWPLRNCIFNCISITAKNTLSWQNISGFHSFYTNLDQQIGPYSSYRYLHWLATVKWSLVRSRLTCSRLASVSKTWWGSSAQGPPPSSCADGVQVQMYLFWTLSSCGPFVYETQLPAWVWENTSLQDGLTVSAFFLTCTDAA